MNDFKIFILYPLTLSAIAYWFTSFIFFLLDIYLAPKFKIKGAEKINWEFYKLTAIYVLKMQALTTPIVLYLMIPLWKLRNINIYLSYDLVSILKLFLCPLLGDIIFFLTHRLCHCNFLYKKVHKLHHQWKYPVAVCASYTTYYEFILCNLPTFLLPPLILRLNWYLANIWFIFSSIMVVIDHSGYNFFKRSIHHTNHHVLTNYNYGSEYLDKLNNSLN